MKSLTEQEKETKETKIKSLVPPRVGDTVDGKKVSAAAREKTKTSLRTKRKSDWEASR